MIYLDHHSTTQVRPEALQAMEPWLGGLPANPASAHAAGRRARRALEDARENIAQHLGAHSDEVVFTSGATEANNLAIFGLAGDSPAHVLTSHLEHPCVTGPIEQLARRGFAVDWLPVTAQGIVSPLAVRDARKPDTRLVAVMLANHEMGAIQPIIQLRLLAEGIAFHCDAAQAIGKIAVDFHALGVSTLSLSAHKFGGPVGVGALLINPCTFLKPLLFGGHQQRGRRPGTEPVALAVGMAAALDAALRDREEQEKSLHILRQRFLDALRASASPVFVNGPEVGGLPSVLNLSFPGCRADALLMALDLAGVCCSTGSACTSGSLLPSPVLRAMNLPSDRLTSALRFSFGWTTTEAEIDAAAHQVIRVVTHLRLTEESAVRT